jgi:hypothetical protein
MEQDRIQINNVWYIREDLQSDVELDPINFEGCVVENDDFSFEATRLLKDYDRGIYDDSVSIKFTDKRIKPWENEHWDNNDWILGVINNVPDSLKELHNLTPEGIKFFQAFLKYLKDNKDWF